MLILLSAATGAPSAPEDAPMSPHDMEVLGFASTLAVAKTTAAACDGARINLTMVEDLRKRLHMVAADKAAFVQPVA